MASSSGKKGKSPTKHSPSLGAGASSNLRSTSAMDSARKAIAQYTLDARLHDVFEKSGVSFSSFNYAQSILTPSETIPDQHITAYLSRIQRGGHIQPFGCTIAVEESTFRVIAYSENAVDMLDLSPQSVPTLNTKITQTITIGMDVRTLFHPSNAHLLERAASAREITLFNPIWIHSRTSGKPFNAILHRVDVGIVIDLEPSRSEDPALSIAGAVQSQKLAVRAISRLQALPSGDVKLLCDSVVEYVRELTGYDRVMVYKFHEDEHGEVVSESKIDDLEPYIGLHYPATDIPQASRFLFKQNRVRMIVDCHATPAKVINDDNMTQPLCLVGSTLRSPHGCHAQYMANMGSIASLAMAVIINRGDGEASSSNNNNSIKLWGLVVCHHTSPRFIPFPLRYACEFLMQAFGLQLNMELQLATQMSEKRMLKTQTFLCDMLLRDSLIGLVNQSPNTMDLVKCDGTAFYYQGKYFSLGMAPSESQIKDMIEWLLTNHSDSAGLTTDSLADAGYPSAASLGNAICGMAVAYITPTDYLFWFRSHTAKEIKWGGAKHHPEDKDDGQRMHPRTSFNAFLEVVKNKSLPWDNAEIDAIHSLQLILRDTYSYRDIAGKLAGSKSREITVNSKSNNNYETQSVDEIGSVAREMVRLIETASAPIFAVDVDGRINGWNAKIAQLTGLSIEHAMGMSLVHHLVFEECYEVVKSVLHRALRGEEDKEIEIKLKTFGLEETKKAVYVMVNACSSKDHVENIVGVCFIGQDITGQKVVMDKFIQIQGDYKTVVHSPNPLIPPIFASDENTCCSEWNMAMEKLTGCSEQEMKGKLLVGEVFGSFCKLKGPDTLTKFMIVLHNAILGKEIDKFPFSFFDRNGTFVQVLLTANPRRNMDGKVVAVFCFLQIASPELQQGMEMQKQLEKICLERIKELAYIGWEIKNPLSGIRFINSMLEGTQMSDEQKQLLETSIACEKQVFRIIQNMDCVNDGSIELEKNDFVVGNAISVIVSQVMILVRERGLELIRDIPEEIKVTTVFGDQERIQQCLSGFLLNMVRCAPSNGWVEIQVKPTVGKASDGSEFVHLQFRMMCPGPGLPQELVQDMFSKGQCTTTQEGFGLSMCMKIMKLMNGQVQYIRESERCCLDIVIDLPFPSKRNP